MQIYPWHATLWQHIMQRHQSQRLPHALLLTGSTGMGKLAFAERLAQALLCEQPQTDGDACGQCKICCLFQSGNHPDFLPIAPVEVGKNILVDHIRQLITFCNFTAHYQRYQVAIIQPAEAMNPNAANSLLKLLEEPPDNTLIILISHRPNSLMATIRSRCQKLVFQPPTLTVVQTWLQQQHPDVNIDNLSLWLRLNHGAPLTTLACLQVDIAQQRETVFAQWHDLLQGQCDPIALAEKWSKLDVLQILQWLSSWTMDLIRAVATQQTDFCFNDDKQAVFSQWVCHCSPSILFKLLHLQDEAYRLLVSGSTVKPQGLLEVITLTWVKLRSQQ